MRIRLLGTAAGGGVPQWNCNCKVCRIARDGTGRVEPRTQSSVAITADEKHWFLLNASPDIRLQIEGFSALHPDFGQIRSSPIQSVLLTNADLDHTLGLFQLREGHKFQIHSTATVRRILTEEMALDSVMAAFCGVDWSEPPLKPISLQNRNGSPGGLLYEAVLLNGSAPRFANSTNGALDNVIGYRFTDPKTAGRFLFLPDVPRLDDALRKWLKECDVLLFDGTFWSEDELPRCGAGTRMASQMGHVPISGLEGSLELLRTLTAKHKIYIHINNTNPILLHDSPERAAVTAAGCIVGNDGMEIII